jgi:hypothetical protein
MNFINAISSAMRNAFAGGTQPRGGYDEAWLAESTDIYELDFETASSRTATHQIPGILKSLSFD